MKQFIVSGIGCHWKPFAPTLVVAAAVASTAWAGADAPALLAQSPAGEAQKKARDLGAPTKRSAFARPKVSTANLLATGDQQVTVKWSNGVSEKKWLVRLEKPWAILRAIPLAEPTLTTADSKLIEEIVTADKKFTWKLAADRKSFEGKAQASPATEAVGVTPRPRDRRQVEQFLLLSFRRMVNRAIDGVADSPSPADVAGVRWIAAKRSEAIARGGLNLAIAALYAALPATLDVVAAQVAIQDRLIAEYNAKIKAQVAERRKIADRQTMAGMFGMVKMFAGAMPDQDVYRGSFGQTFTVDRGPVSPELMAGGLRDITNASMAGASQLAMLDNIKQMADEAQQKAMTASLSIQMEAVGTLHAQFNEVAAGEYKIPDADPIPPEEWSKPRRTGADYRPLIDRLAAAGAREKEGLGFVNPFAQLDLLFFQSLVPGYTRSEQLEKWQEQARGAIKLAGEVPADPILDYDRAEILATGAELALRAAEVEVGSNRWADAYHPRAEFAAKALDLALKYLPDGPSGHVREKKARALLLLGQVDDALRLAREVVDVSKDSARHRFQLARVECAAGLTSQGLDDLEAAIVGLGFLDIDEARRHGGDFPNGDKRFKELTEIELSIDDGRVPRGLFGSTTGPRVVVTNRSRFVLTDVAIALEYSKFVGRAAFGQPAKTAEHVFYQRVEKLDPGESMVVALNNVGSVKTTPRGMIYGRLKLNSRQGVSRIYVSG